MRIARVASVLALAAGVILGWGILFGPFFYGCTSTTVAPDQTPTPQVCRGSSLIEVQGSDLFPAPLLWILMWSLAPLLAVIGVLAEPPSAHPPHRHRAAHGAHRGHQSRRGIHLRACHRAAVAHHIDRVAPRQAPDGIIQALHWGVAKR